MKRLLRSIFGMSKSKSDMGAWIEDHTLPVMCAIAQLYIFPHADARKHWRHEVWEKFPRIHKFKGSNKLPSQKFIYENSWEIDKDNVQDAINWAIGKEYKLTPRDDIDIAELSFIMQEYFTWLSKNLSTSIVLIERKTLEKLDELGLTE